MKLVAVEFPCDPEPLDSRFYIHRPPIEELTYQEITRPGSFLRIQAPKKMGKTSLVLRLIDYAKQLGRTVYLDFQLAESAVFATLDKFLRWFCANISRQLQLPSQLDDYWDEDIGSKVSCSIYFQGYLLENIDSPLVLVLNQLDRIFEYSKIASEFFSLLRSWHEEAKRKDIWQKLRLVVVYSTEVYIRLNINQSPFNVGLGIKLPEFTSKQIQDLAQRHGLNWTDDVGRQNALSLQTMVGGHPYLVRLGLYHLVNSPEKSLTQLLQEAPTISGIYSPYLREILVIIQQNPELATALKQVIASGSSVVDHILAYQLESMGLVKLNGNQCTISCEIYRLYFAAQNLEEQNLREQIEQLQRQNQELQRLSNTDDLTQIANKRYFDIYLKQQWQLAREKSPITLLMLEIDYFSTYKKTLGKEAGDNCLRKVASTISQVLSSYDKCHNSIAFRYGAVEFAVILPNIIAYTAFKIAETIRKEVKKLVILHSERIGGLPASVVTVSLGIACIIPKDESPNILVSAAEEALYQSRRNQRDRTYISTTLNYGMSDNSNDI